MAYFRSPAKIVDLTAPSGGVTVGLFYLIGAVLVCANVTAAEGETFPGVTEGLFDDAAKATGSAWTEGAKLYWDDTNSRFTTSASGSFRWPSTWGCSAIISTMDMGICSCLGTCSGFLYERSGRAESCGAGKGRPGNGAGKWRWERAPA